MIPDYQTLMLPLLRLAQDGQEHRIRDVIEPLAKQLGLTADDLAEMLPSGRQPVFNNRVHWAKTYLAQAKLLEITRRAHFRITDRGREVLRENPHRIDVRLLERFPEFNEFKKRARESQTGGLSPSTAEITTAVEAKLATPSQRTKVIHCCRRRRSGHTESTFYELEKPDLQLPAIA
jgi:restriction system protein